MTKQVDSGSKTNPGMSKEKIKALELAISQIEKQFGKGSIMKLGSERAMIPIPAISTGSIGLDRALGIGGVPRGRVVEIYGPEASGKTTLALTIIAQAQRVGGTAVFIDAEHAFPAEFSSVIGVDLDNLSAVMFSLPLILKSASDISSPSSVKLRTLTLTVELISSGNVQIYVPSFGVVASMIVGVEKFADAVE